MRIRIKAIVAVVSLLSIIVVSNMSHVVLANAHVHSDDCFTSGVTQHFHDNKSDCHTWSSYSGAPCIRCYTEGGYGYYPCPDCDGEGHKGVICTGTYRISEEVDCNRPYCNKHDGQCKNVSAKEYHFKCDACGKEADDITITVCERGVTSQSASYPFNPTDTIPVKHSDTDDPYVPCSTCGGSGNSDILCPYCEGDAWGVTRPCSVCGGDYMHKDVCENCTNGKYVDSSKCDVSSFGPMKKETVKSKSGANTIETGDWYYDAECTHCGVHAIFKCSATLVYNTSTGADQSFTGTVYAYYEGSNNAVSYKSWSGAMNFTVIESIFPHAINVNCPECNGTGMSDCVKCYKGYQTMSNICPITPGAYNADGTVATSFCNKVVTEINPRK